MHDLMSYMERLELMAFFTAYPLVYTLVQFIAGQQRNKSATFINRLVRLLPIAYALTGTLFLGLVLKNLYPDYSMKNIAGQFQNSFLKVWGLLAVLFWVPALSKKTVFSLLHSLVFFFLLVKDLYLNIFSSPDPDMIKNDMRIYSDSFILNTGALTAITIIYLLINRLQGKKKDSAL